MRVLPSKSWHRNWRRTARDGAGTSVTSRPDAVCSARKIRTFGARDKMGGDGHSGCQDWCLKHSATHPSRSCKDLSRHTSGVKFLN